MPGQNMMLRAYWYARAIAQLLARVVVLEGLAKPFGIGSVPTIILNAQTTITVRVAPPAPNTSYTPDVEILATASILAGLSILSATVTDATHVDVTVKNTGLATFAGAYLIVRMP